MPRKVYQYTCRGYEYYIEYNENGTTHNILRSPEGKSTKISPYFTPKRFLDVWFIRKLIETDNPVEIPDCSRHCADCIYHQKMSLLSKFVDVASKK